MKAAFGVDAMPETGENVATDLNVSREDQDLFALRSQARAAAAQASGRFAAEIVPVVIPQRKGADVVVAADEHPRATSMEALAKLKPIVRGDGTVTAGNASGVNDGAAALIVASEAAVRRHGLTPRARILATASAGVAPRVMGIGPIPASRKVLARLGLDVTQMDVVELNEAFASQALAVLRGLGAAGRRRPHQPQRRCHRPRPPARHERRQARPDGDRGTAAPQGPLCALHDVRRRRPGDRDGGRTRLTGSGTSTCVASERFNAFHSDGII